MILFRIVSFVVYFFLCSNIRTLTLFTLNHFGFYFDGLDSQLIGKIFCFKYSSYALVFSMIWDGCSLRINNIIFRLMRCTIYDWKHFVRELQVCKGYKLLCHRQLCFQNHRCVNWLGVFFSIHFTFLDSVCIGFLALSQTCWFGDHTGSTLRPWSAHHFLRKRLKSIFINCFYILLFVKVAFVHCWKWLQV